jgi:ubiquinone/menaquinone biosynthesis C-methylase UbiE
MTSKEWERVMPPKFFEYALEHLPGRAYVRDNIEILGLRNLIGEVRIGRGLHLSCGDGQSTGAIVRCFSPEQMYGVDGSEESIAKARKNPAFNAIRFSTQSALKLSFEDDFFDAVFDLADIHNYPDWRIVLDEVKRVTKPGGLFFIEDLSAESFEYAAGKFFKALTAHQYDAMMKLDEFNEYLKAIGFEILRFEEKNQLGVFKFFRMIAKKP